MHLPCERIDNVVPNLVYLTVHFVEMEGSGTMLTIVILLKLSGGANHGFTYYNLQGLGNS